MKFGVLVHPASITHEDLIYVLDDVKSQTVVRLWYDDSDFNNIDAVFLPSSGVYREGYNLLKQTPMMHNIIRFAQKGGFVFGSGNAFRLLCDFDLLPGNLVENPSGRFVGQNSFVKVDNNNTRISALYNGDLPLKLPIATYSGRFVASGQELKDMNTHKQIIFRFADAEGVVNNKANITGAVNNIAGISNSTRNVFGMIPFPERAVDDELGNTDGQLIFDSVIRIVGRSISRNLV